MHLWLFSSFTANIVETLLQLVTATTNNLLLDATDNQRQRNFQANIISTERRERSGMN